MLNDETKTSLTDWQTRVIPADGQVKKKRGGGQERCIMTLTIPRTGRQSGGMGMTWWGRTSFCTGLLQIPVRSGVCVVDRQADLGLLGQEGRSLYMWARGVGRCMDHLKILPHLDRNGWDIFPSHIWLCYNTSKATINLRKIMENYICIGYMFLCL